MTANDPRDGGAPKSMSEVTSGPTIDATSVGAAELAAAILDRRISALEATEACLARIRAVDPAIGAIAALDADGARRAARLADETLASGARPGPLCGVPVTIKDCFDVAGVTSTAGAAARARRVPQRDATAVARLRAAGAVILGKTNMPELGMGHETDNRVYGRTNNPYDLARTPGGSSGGSAAAVAAGMSALDVGNDGGGSLRIPAHYCGVAAIKPTVGRVPKTGGFPGGGWIDALFVSPGPVARRVADLALALPILAGPDGRDPEAIPAPLGDLAAGGVSGLRVAVRDSDELFPATAATAATVRRAADALSDAGARVTEGFPDIFELAVESWLNMLYCDTPGFEALIAGLGEDSLHPWTRTALDQYRAVYPQLEVADLVECLGDLRRLRAEMLAFMAGCDAILCPVAGFSAPLHGAGLDGDNALAYGYSIAWNALGWPAGVVRCGASPHGAPIGVQIVAAPWNERVVLTVAQALEDALGGWQPPDLAAAVHLEGAEPPRARDAAGGSAVYAHAHAPRDAITLCVVADENYLEPSSVTLRSALRYHRDLRAKLITDVPDSDGCQRLLRSLGEHRAQLEVVPVDGDRFAELSLTASLPHLSRAVYWRLLIPELVTDAERAIYLDSDALVRGDLRALWEADLGDSPFGAVADDHVGLQQRFSHVSDYRTRLGLAPDAPLLCAGMMIMDMEACRREDLAGRVVSFARDYPERMFVNEQSALTCLYDGRWRPLDRRWNTLVHPLTADLDVSDAAIVHFLGTPKPWQPMCGSPCRDEWLALMDPGVWGAPRPRERRAELDAFPERGGVWIAGEGEPARRVRAFLRPVADDRFRGYIGTRADPDAGVVTVEDAVERSGDDDVFVNLVTYAGVLACYILVGEREAVYWAAGPAPRYTRDGQVYAPDAD